MSPTVLLVTDRPGFAETWRPVLQQAGLSVNIVGADAIGSAISDSAAVVLDGGGANLDEDELLANAALARALKAQVAVALPEGGELRSIEDVLDDLCLGLVARDSGDVARIANALARRCDRDRFHRFEYLTVSPRDHELLAVLGDGTAVLLTRPVSAGDDGSTVTSISISEDATRAALTLDSGKQIFVEAAAATRSYESGKNGFPDVVNGQTAVFVEPQQLGARLRHLRLAAGLTQAELARRTGIHRPNIARVEAGRHTPSLETLARLASAIGVSATRVLSGE